MNAAVPATLSSGGPMSLWQLYVGLRGRIGRRQFWLQGVLALAALALFATALLDIAQLPAERSELLVDVLLFWPLLAVSAKRWHDRNRSGWWVLVLFVPLIGWLWALIDNGFVRGTAGANRFGDDPLAGQSTLNTGY